MKSLLEYGRAGVSLDEFDVVDMHGHLGQYAFHIADLSADGMVRVMDRLGVAATLVSHMRCMSIETERGNREVLAAMQAHPGRILGYIICWPTAAAEVRDVVERWLAAGFTGIKLHNSVGYSYADPAYAPAYEIANAQRLPILFHTWGEDHVLAEIRQQAERYPEASFILAHAGCGNVEGYLAMARACPNVYLDLTLSRAPRGLLEHFVAEAGAERIVWGSDIYFLSQTQQLGKVLGAKISDDDKLRILSANAKEILARASQLGTPIS